VIFLATRTTAPFDQYRLGTIECDDKGALFIMPEVASLAEGLFRDIDRNATPAVLAAMRSAPEHFDGGYLRAAYEES
jgi:hypothetical protein